MLPVIEFHEDRLRENLRLILSACQRRGVRLAAVTKAFCADPRITETLARGGADMLADARVQNLARLPEALPRLCLRIADPGQADEVVRLSEYSLQSTREALRALGAAARRQNRLHRVILMIDLGDLREGVYHRDEGLILETARLAAGEKGLELAGVGANLTCFGGILPDEENLGRLIGIAELIREKLALPLPIISGGNSSSLHLLFEGRLPGDINHLRVGEGLLLGMDTASGRPFPQLRQDVFSLRARLVEVFTKPSRPEGSSGPNAFGERVCFEDLGPMRRGILAVGRQDTDPDGLRPQDGRVSVLGASSDHLIVDLSRAPEYGVGDELSFTPAYGALLRAYTSAYVAREYH